MRGWRPWLTKKGDSCVADDTRLLIVNSASESQSAQSSWRALIQARRYFSISAFSRSVLPSVCGW